MIKTLIKSAALAAMILTGAAGAITATASPAEAGNYVQFSFGTGGSGVVVGSSRRHHPPRYSYCDPRQAVHKAANMGLRRAHIVRNGRNRVAVAGNLRGHPVRVVFANQRGCPVIARR